MAGDYPIYYNNIFTPTWGQDNWHIVTIPSISTVPATSGTITFTATEDPKPIMFTKEKPYAVIYGGCKILGSYNEGDARTAAQEMAHKEKTTVFIVKVFATEKPEYKTVSEQW